MFRYGLALGLLLLPSLSACAAPGEQWIVVTAPAFRKAVEPLCEHRKAQGLRVVVVQTADVLTAKEIAGRGDLDLEIKGFIDDDRMKLGRSVIQGHKVLGSTRDLPNLVRSLGIDRVVITIAQASRQDIHRIVKVCEQIPVKVKIIPGLYEILDGSVGISSIRDVRIEDLLGRETVQLDIESISRELAGKVVMVTGAGGAPALRFLSSDLAAFSGINWRTVLRHGPLPLLFQLFGAAKTKIGFALAEKFLRLLLIDFKTVGLAIRTVASANIGAFIPVNSQPLQVFEDLRFIPRLAALHVGVFDAQNHRAILLPGEQPVEQRGARVAHVEMSGR